MDLDFINQQERNEEIIKERFRLYFNYKRLFYAFLILFYISTVCNFLLGVKDYSSFTTRALKTLTEFPFIIVFSALTAKSYSLSTLVKSWRKVCRGTSDRLVFCCPCKGKRISDNNINFSLLIINEKKFIMAGHQEDYLIKDLISYQFNKKELILNLEKESIVIKSNHKDIVLRYLKELNPSLITA